jgi:hypothetical protein
MDLHAKFSISSENNWSETRLLVLSIHLSPGNRLVYQTAYNIPTGIQWILISRLENLDFADNICNLSHPLQYFKPTNNCQTNWPMY